MENCVAPGLDKMWSIIRCCIVFSQSRIFPLDYYILLLFLFFLRVNNYTKVAA